MEPSMVIEKLSQFNAKNVDLNDPKTRKEALALSQKLTVSLEHPVSAVVELTAAIYPMLAARVAIDLDIFNLVAKHEGPMTTAQLAAPSAADEALVSRILRFCASLDLIQQETKDTWIATPKTHAMALPAVISGHKMYWELTTRACLSAPQFFRETGFKTPIEANDGFFQLSHQTKLNMFEWLAQRPALLADFNTFMGNTMGARRYWVDWFPVKERLLNGADVSTALLVDVGGGRGHDVQAFCSKWPGLGRLVLQDLPQGLEGVKESDLGDGVETMVQDFFKEQAIKGSRAYFLHHILHDWSDKYCLRILEHLRDAMKPGYSKLLIHELILPDQDATTYLCAWDLKMMAVGGGMERSRSEWQVLLEKAGLEVLKFWVDDEEADGIVEVVVKQ